MIKVYGSFDIDGSRGDFITTLSNLTSEQELSQRLTEKDSTLIAKIKALLPCSLEIVEEGAENIFESNTMTFDEYYNFLCKSVSEAEGRGVDILANNTKWNGGTKVWTSEGEVVVTITDRDFKSTDEVYAALRQEFTEEQVEIIGDQPLEGQIVDESEDLSGVKQVSTTWSNYVLGLRDWLAECGA